jgi:hypothetical protein
MLFAFGRELPYIAASQLEERTRLPHARDIIYFANGGETATPPRSAVGARSSVRCCRRCAEPGTDMQPD